MTEYLLSLPERTVRAVAAGVGGLVHETTTLVLPASIRRSRLYQATVARVLRITVELVGGVTDVYALDVSVQELAARKAAGNVIELASVLAVGWSPLWLLAAAADLTGGTRAYLRALASELRLLRVLPEEMDVTSVEELLNALEQTSGVMADAIDVPPLNVSTMRESWQALRQHAAQLPDANTLASIFAGLQQAAAQEGHSLLEVSSLIAAGAVRTGVQVGNTYIFEYYRDALRTITTEGLPAYLQRVASPYRAAVRRHLDPTQTTYTGRLLRRFRRRLQGSHRQPEDGSSPIV